MTSRKPHPKATQIGGFCSPKFKDGYRRCGVLWLPPAEDRAPQVFPISKFSLEQRAFLLESPELDVHEQVSPEDAAADALACALEDAAAKVAACAAELLAADVAAGQADARQASAHHALGEAEAALAALQKRHAQREGKPAKGKPAEGFGTSPSAPAAPAELPPPPAETERPTDPERPGNKGGKR